MSRLSYINQMNGFLEKREIDCLPPGAVLLYLVLFKEFNKTKWKYDWLTLTTRKLTCLIGNNSASFLYSNRRILVDLEYIQIRQSGSALHRRTEYHLVPLYDIKFSAGIVDDEEFYQPEYVPVEGANYGTQCGTKSGTLTNLPEENVPFEGTNHGTQCGTKSGTLTALPDENVPFGGTNHGTQCGTKSGTLTNPPNEPVPSNVPSGGTKCGTKNGTKSGTLTASQPLCPKASQSPKNKIEEKDKNLSGSIPQYEGIQSPKTNQQEEAQPRIPKPPTEEEFHLCFDTYNVCLNREPTYDEKMKLIELVRKYTAKNVLEALNHLYEKALNESPEIVVTSHKRGKPDSLHITLEACEKLVWQRKMGLDKPMPRRTEPVKGWEDFRPA